MLAPKSPWNYGALGRLCDLFDDPDGIAALRKQVEASGLDFGPDIDPLSPKEQEKFRKNYREYLGKSTETVEAARKVGGATFGVIVQLRCRMLLHAQAVLPDEAIDLDAPVSVYMPEFAPRNPYKAAITLRQLMSHRSGLVREPPAGHYFDPAPPPLIDVVKSLAGTTLVFEPGTHTKYSNAGIAVVGAVVEQGAAAGGRAGHAAWQGAGGDPRFLSRHRVSEPGVHVEPAEGHHRGHPAQPAR